MDLYDSSSKRTQQAIDTVVIFTSIVMAAAMTGGIVGGWAAGTLGGGAVTGFIAGGLAGGVVGGAGFEYFEIGTFEEGFVAGFIAGALAGAAVGSDSGPAQCGRSPAAAMPWIPIILFIKGVIGASRFNYIKGDVVGSKTSRQEAKVLQQDRERQIREWNGYKEAPPSTDSGRHLKIKTPKRQNVCQE